MSANFSRRTIIRASAVSALPLALVALNGCQSAPAQPTPAPEAAGASKLFMDVSMVQSTLNIPQKDQAARGCVMTNRFPRNGEIVWRAKVYDGKTGDPLDDKGISKATVKLADGTAVDMKYGGHPGKNPVDFYWTANWLVPKDHPTGTLNYDIAVAAVDGRTTDYKPLNVAPSLLTITDEVLDTIATPVPAAAATPKS
ncbi:MAG TPA: hypothetical protein VFZ25_16490 [Chloroflexota bacterium]|nr:hypothetical protein [Chloroflexota bacterium]